MLEDLNPACAYKNPILSLCGCEKPLLCFCLFKERRWESQGLRFPSHSSSWKNTDNCDDSPQATDSKSDSGEKNNVFEKSRYCKL